MINSNEAAGVALVASKLGSGATDAIGLLDLGDLLQEEHDGWISRRCFAASLNILLFHDLLGRVPSGAAYVLEQRAAGQRICFDHGALRTIRFPDRHTGALPPGERAFTRILEPLGYVCAGAYPLPRLRMTGRAYAHADAPSAMPQFFVSELHVEQFDADFGAAADAVFGSSRDPLGEATKDALARLRREQRLPFDVAATAIGEIFGAFDRQHDVPRLADYETLLSQSAEAAWIATEGNAFNHATDRVPDVELLAARERALGRPIKESIEVSASGRVRQTAYRADTVRRLFSDPEGLLVTRSVPGSFYEFISRDIDPQTGELDLRFDSANATGIFAMTRAAA